MTVHGLWFYQVTTEIICDQLLGQYRTYGLLVSCKTEKGWEQAEQIKDVTTDAIMAEKLAQLFNEHQLSPVHLKDALDNMLP